MTAVEPDGARHPEALGFGRLFWLTSEAVVGADLAAECVVLWNPAAERLFGYTAREALGMRLEELVPHELRNAHLSGIRRYRETKVPVLIGGEAVVVPAVTKLGERRDIALSLTDLSQGGGDDIVLAVIRDVTAQKRAERELTATNAAMREFVATASHDLRTPLTSVLGYARLLQQHGDRLRDEQRAEYLEAIVHAAHRATRLVDDLLTQSQIDAGAVATRPEAIHLASAVFEAAERAACAAEVDVSDGIVVRCDRDHLERILTNYLSNAARYGTPPVTVSANVVGATVEVHVGDRGPGVPEGFEERLFTRFARADTTSGVGTGLGLAIVRGLAEANGGGAFYERRDGGGACFGVRLPTDTV